MKFRTFFQAYLFGEWRDVTPEGQDTDEDPTADALSHQGRLSGAPIRALDANGVEIGNWEVV